MSPLRSRAAAAVIAAAGVLLSGCSSKPKVVPVSGTVLIDGKPLGFGFVQVAPAGYRPATAKIGPDGRFTLTTTDDDDGVATGTHPAAVIAVEPIGGGAQKWHAPKEYASTDTSKLKVTIDGPTTDLKIELTWNGGQPFVERFGKE